VPVGSVMENQFCDTLIKKLYSSLFLRLEVTCLGVWPSSNLGGLLLFCAGICSCSDVGVGSVADYLLGRSLGLGCFFAAI
jgi:hypothetical protein